LEGGPGKERGEDRDGHEQAQRRRDVAALGRSGTDQVQQLAGQVIVNLSS
jgi:hypothetical protein